MAFPAVSTTTPSRSKILKRDIPGLIRGSSVRLLFACRRARRVRLRLPRASWVAEAYPMVLRERVVRAYDAGEGSYSDREAVGVAVIVRHDPKF